jgi:hypothetical protein
MGFRYNWNKEIFGSVSLLLLLWPSWKHRHMDHPRQ